MELLLKKILIIGNQGYLGSKLSDYLSEYGYECFGTDIAFFNMEYYTNQKIKMLDKDARNITAKDLAKFDCVLMLAGVSNDPFGNLDPKLLMTLQLNML